MRLVEVGCGYQTDRNAIQRAILEGDYVWHIECVDLKRANAEAEVGIDGSEMRINKSFLASNSPQRIASVMAHELMHNRGFTHRSNDVGTPLYSLTVPEQVEACILNDGSGGEHTPVIQMSST